MGRAIRLAFRSLKNRECTERGMQHDRHECDRCDSIDELHTMEFNAALIIPR